MMAKKRGQEDSRREEGESGNIGLAHIPSSLKPGLKALSVRWLSRWGAPIVRNPRHPARILSWFLLALRRIPRFLRPLNLRRLWHGDCGGRCPLG